MIVIILVFGWWLFSLGNKEENLISLRVESIPKDVIIRINDKVSSNGTKLKPGKYAVKVERDDFSSNTQVVVIEDRSSRYPNNEFVLTVTLDANSEKGRNILKKYSEKDYLELEGKSSQSGSSIGEDFKKENPIIGLLPYIQSYYRIDYGKTDEGKFKIVITANEPIGRQVAVERIRSWGFNPTNYLIEFKDFYNIFSPEQNKPIEPWGGL